LVSFENWALIGTATAGVWGRVEIDCMICFFLSE